MGFVAILSLGACVLALLVACRVVLRANDNPPAAWTLALFLLSTAAFVADQIVYRQDWFAQMPHLFALANPFIAAIFPSLFLYVRGVTHPTRRWSPLSLLHYTPALLLGLLEIPTYLLPAVEKTAAARAQLARGSATPDELLSLALLNLYALGYLAAAWRTLRASRARLAESAEEGRSRSPRGLESFVIIFLSFTLVSGALDFTPWRFSGSLIAALAAVVAVYAAVWLLTDHQPLLSAPARASAPAPLPHASPPTVSAENPHSAEVPVPTPPPPPPPNQDSPPSPPAPVLRPADLERLQRRLDKLFRDERIHLDADLSLQSLADRAETTRHKMSAAIRALHGLTFYQLVARHRVHEAARLLHAKNAAHRTIADIAFSTGFNTLSAFNAAFKAEFGQTPSRFRENPPGAPALPPEANSSPASALKKSA